MDDDTTEPFGFPAVGCKKLTAAFDGGRLTSDGGVMLLVAAERRFGLCDRLAALIADPRDPSRVVHPVADILRALILAIACGNEDADDLDHLRHDPGFKLACGRLPDSGRDLCSQPMSLFNRHYDERCFLPIHVYDTAICRPVAVLLRPGKTPSGIEVRGHLHRLVRQPRQHWPQTRITLRGDGHYGRPEVMAFCEAADIDYVFGLPTNATLRGLVEGAADDVRVRRAEDDAPVLRRYGETRYGARSWSQPRRVVTRIEASTLGLDICFVVTSFGQGNAEWVYDSLYCAWGQAENLIKLHKTQLASDRTSCRSSLANQVRLVLHTAAYWLKLSLRERIPKPHPLASAEFATLQRHLLKIAGRIIETTSRIRIAIAAACPQAVLFRGIARSFQTAGP